MKKQDFELAQGIIRMTCPDILQKTKIKGDRYRIYLNSKNMKLISIIDMISEFKRKRFEFSEYAKCDFVEVLKIER